MRKRLFQSTTIGLAPVEALGTSLRKKLRQGCCLTAAIALVAATASAQKTTCTDDPVVFTIYSSYNDPSTLTPYAAAILPDGLGSYVNGQNGVSAVLETCNGTGHAVLTLGKSRSVGLDLRHTVDTTSQTPSWANSVVPTSIVNIWKVLYNYNPTATYSFTTGMGLVGVNNPLYDYRMENPLRDPSSSADAGANVPCATALVNVTHYPATSTSKETWIAWPDATPTSCTAGSPAQVGTLLYSTKTLVNVGQFTTPFYMVIQRP